MQSPMAAFWPSATGSATSSCIPRSTSAAARSETGGSISSATASSPAPRGRPHLYAIVPLIVLVEEAYDVAYPTAHQFGPCHHDVHYVGSAPVVTHQVDRPLEALYSVTSQR